MNKAEHLYGRYATKAFIALAIYFCSKARNRLKLNLTELIASEGLTTRVDDVGRAIDWWIDRENEFKDIK